MIRAEGRWELPGENQHPGPQPKNVWPATELRGLIESREGFREPGFRRELPGGHDEGRSFGINRKQERQVGFAAPAIRSGVVGGFAARAGDRHGVHTRSEWVNQQINFARQRKEGATGGLSARVRPSRADKRLSPDHTDRVSLTTCLMGATHSEVEGRP